ncbi:glutathione synthase [Buchnera aphidicola]|jgi:glutathione synthase|uniref:Glutathione synthetase n=1 Tax=Buchnera aphidicola subsp. Schizaphis graminum (strain Sg) TaxID=198804 RepID=GSHB_BUCAP|nr:glutathione synthase [Buchnera aphidicola]Q8K931.1 RecName: Full=Glutathione synthetase; AltName: Full=GSH synthetase; Short=GSH-S; Short=GSHase; AltName: Full=Glutathione synthase [Buchnera aphidicola str. Sg (Schizaphis graminum)]AAM68070.1 glutathione synthetase [Buchnera aphidicola str. Sg (Schizaphis graminum)]AWI49439.1 glutathione synthase [Buchnera aphidicola (Schizaphis graminum)]
MRKKKNLKIGIVMDSITLINIKKDSSFAILLEAQKRQHEIYYMEMNDLYLRKGQSYATTKSIEIQKNQNNYFKFIQKKDISLNELDAILMRKDPPFNTEFIYATYILERAEEKGVLVINKPKSLRDCNEKIFISWFSRFTTDTLVTRKLSKIHNFWKEKNDIILKPLDAMGGKGVFRIKKDDPNFSVIVETLTNYEKKYCMIQTYLPEVQFGDKRILIVNGKPIPWSLTRIPKHGETRANLAVGGEGRVQKLNDKDWEIANYLAPILKKRGLILVGLDVIGDKLTEINVTSPTCICEIEEKKNISITGILIDYIEDKIYK